MPSGTQQLFVIIYNLIPGGIKMAQKRRRSNKLSDRTAIALCAGIVAAIFVIVIAFMITYSGRDKDASTSSKAASGKAPSSSQQASSTASSSKATSSSASDSVQSSSQLASSAASASKVTPSAAASSKRPASGALTLSPFVGQTSDWRLLLANRNNVVTGYSPDTTSIPRANCQDGQDYRFDSRAYDDLMNMINAAADDGVKLTVVSSYRRYESQQRLYNKKVQYYKNKGYSDADAREVAATVVAVPGTSDHGLGLAVDFNYLSPKYENTKELTWLRNNAEEYGFVMRYPKNKENVTGVIYEPWHYRYVGVDNAVKMNDEGLCLEEYVEKLVK